MSHIKEDVTTTFRENRTAITVTVACVIFIGFVLVWPNLFKTSQPSTTVTVEAPVPEEEAVEPEIAGPDMEELRVSSRVPKIEVPVTPETPNANDLRRGMPTEQHIEPAGINPKRFVTSGYYVQVGSFQSQSNADDLAKRLEISGWNTRIELKEGGIYAVWVGPESTREMAEANMTKLEKSAGLKGYIVNLHP